MIYMKCIHPHKSMRNYCIDSYISFKEFLILLDDVIGLPITMKSDPLSIASFGVIVLDRLKDY